MTLQGEFLQMELEASVATTKLKSAMPDLKKINRAWMSIRNIDSRVKGLGEAIEQTTRGVKALEGEVLPDLKEINRERMKWKNIDKRVEYIDKAQEEYQRQLKGLGKELPDLKKLVKTTTDEVKQVNKLVKKASKVTDALKQGLFKEVNPKLGSVVSVGASLISLGLTTWAIKNAEAIQDINLRQQDLNSKELDIITKRIENDHAHITSLEKLNKQNIDKLDKVYAEAAGAVQNATVAREKANEALYETRAGRTKLEAQIADAKKQSNDALYETRAGRTKLEAQIADANKQTTGQRTELLTLEKEVRQFTVQTQAEFEKKKADLDKTKVDVEKTKADLDKTRVDLNKSKVDVEKTKADLDKTKVDVEKIDTKIKEQEKVNKEAIPKLDQILGILPFIPARTADVIRPSIPTVPQIENAAKTGTCQTFQPGGCGANALNGLGNSINQNTNNQSNNLFDKINAGANAAANAAQLVLLKVIDNKLGAQIVGGISGKLVAGFQWLQLDRALNVLTFAATIQNHVMLSNNIAETLFGAFENILKIIGFKGDDGKPFSLSSSIEALVKGIVGKENYTVISETWAKANRIYQATTNVLNAFQNISSTILSGLELVAGQTGKIGNALRKSGEVLETAYGWMNPQPKINRVTQTLENLNQGASTIQQITQVPLDTIEALTGLQTANTEFVKALQEDDKPKNKSTELPEPNVLKAVEKGNKAVSAGKDLADVDKEEDE